MKKVTILIPLFLFGVFCYGLMFPEISSAQISEWIFSKLYLTTSQTGEVADCGKKIIPLEIYDKISLYALGAGFLIFLIAILLDNKTAKKIFFIMGAIPVCIWAYVNFFIDYDEIRRKIFNYNIQAESTLANIAEAQDRYKSEQETYIKDLKELTSHISGSHGIDECVRINELNVSWDHWSAEAQHVSSPEAVKWDSTSGSSLKKG